VRARVAFGLATISTGPQRRADARLLGEVFVANDSDAILKCAAFEALRWMVGRPITVELDDTSAEEVVAMVEEIAEQ
jgi:CMP-N-acetylneuraminic acid synthetase